MITKVMSIFLNPRLWVVIGLGYFFLMNIGLLIAAWGPPILVAEIANANGLDSFDKYIEAFHAYINESAGINISRSQIMFSLIYASITSPLYISACILALLRKPWTRHLFIILLGVRVVVLLEFAYSNQMPIYEGIDFMAIAVIILLTRRSVVEWFQISTPNKSTHSNA